MTDKEAEQILDWLTGSFSKRLEENERFVWLATLANMDAAHAMDVALKFAQSGERFPSVPDFRRAVRGYIDREERKPDPTDAIPRSKPPLWIFKWIAARFLFRRFDREQDMRPLREQADWCGPVKEWMPEDEWVEEAKKISEAEVWSAVQSNVLKDAPE